MPPRPKKAAPSLVDQLQAEALPPVPEGAPALVEFHKLNRRQRAGLIGALSALEPKLAEYQSLASKTEEAAPATLSFAETGQLLEFVADVEDLLTSVSKNPDEFRAWAQEATEMDLLAMLGVFTKGLGEASSSSS